MKKKIYRVGLKKILVSVLLIIMLFQVIMPSIVWAATIEKYMSYYEWMNGEETKKYSKIIEKATRKKLKEFYSQKYPENESAIELAIEQDLSNPTQFMIEGKLNTGGLFGAGKGFEIITYGITKEAHDEKEETNKTYSYNELLKWTEKTQSVLDDEIVNVIVNSYFKGVETLEGDATPEDVARTILEENRSTIEFDVIGSKDSYQIVKFEVPGKDEYTLKVEAGQKLGIPTAEDDDDDDSADLGGILLSPLFSLVNFIADSIMCLLQNNMLPSESIGWSVMKSSKMSISGTTKSAEVILADDAVALGGILTTIKWPHITYTPEKIFSGEVDLLSIDFITGKNSKGDTNTALESVRNVVAQWYNVLRMIAIIGLLSVLIYTGIKIIISANAKDKAKYKEWIINWIVAVGILFFMHYIMALIVYSTNEFSGLLKDASGKIIVSYKGETSDTNLMGAVRFMIQSDNFYAKIGYEVMYIALIVYTIKFTFIYLKRVLNMAFLTLIAPIVALTYPLDKINDGKAQGFDMWLKEYIFNALLQPMHLIMYYILMGSAIGIAAENPLYGIVVLAFLTEAERLLKKIFGFDKAGGGTVGGMGNAFAAGAIASNIAKLAKLPKGNASKGGSGGSDDGASNYMDMLKPEKDNPVSDNFENLLDDGAPENGAGDNEEPNNDDGQGNQENQGDQGDQGMPPQPANGSGSEPQLPDDSGSGGEPNTPEQDGGRALKKGLRVAGGAALGLTAAAVQAGISITDGKYNPMEGIGAFTAGYAGGGRIANQVGGAFGSLANTFNEGYYADKEGQAKLLKKRQEQFMYDDNVDKAYMKKYNYDAKKAQKMKELAKDKLVPYGITETKDQFAVQNFAKHVVNSKEGLNEKQQEALLAQAIEQGRKTQGFIDNLTAQGQQKAINDPAQQQKYIDAQLKAAGVTAESEKGQNISRNLNNAFKSAAVYQQINRKR